VPACRLSFAKHFYAYNQPTGAQATHAAGEKVDSAGFGGLTAEARSLYARLYDYAEEAKFGAA